jgi:Tfp pilus assembly protein PilO
MESIAVTLLIGAVLLIAAYAFYAKGPSEELVAVLSSNLE